MNSKVKKLGLLIIMLVLVAMTLTACQLSNTLEDKLDKYGLSAQISYHGNGGRINDNEALLVADVYYQAGDAALNLGVDKKTGTLSVVRTNYTFGGWYYPATNPDGSIRYIDKENDLAELGEEFDFGTYRAAEGDVIHLYAKWLSKQSVKYLLAPEPTISDQLTYKNVTYYADNTESVLRTENFGDSTYISSPRYDPLGDKDKTYSFVDYYYDKECTSPVVWPVNMDTTIDGDIYIYARYLSKEWTVVDTASDFIKIFNGTDGKYYIKNNIDGKDSFGRNASVTLGENTTFSGIIQGNGFTISNFDFVNAMVRDGSTVSIFGAIASGAKITDITFKDFNASFKPNTGCKISAYFFASDIADDAVISNVTVNGGELKMILTLEDVTWLNSAETAPIYKNDEDGREGLTIESAPALQINKY